MANAIGPNRQDDQKERPQRVDQQRGSGEQKLQHLAEEVADTFLHVVSTALDIHSGHRNHVAGRPAQLFELTVELLVRDEVGRFGVAHHRLVFEFVFLLAVLVHVERLRFEHPVRALYDGAQHSVDRAEDECRKKHDAEADGERSQQRIHVNGFGAGERLPHAYGHVEQRTQPRDAFRHACHVGAERHHLGIERAQDGVQVVELYGHQHHNRCGLRVTSSVRCGCRREPAPCPYRSSCASAGS